jgi:Tol biopolymer transport system component
MKRCPECRRDYYDDSLLYCLDDGSALLDGPARGYEPPTAVLHETAPPSEATTRAQIHLTEHPAADTPTPDRSELSVRDSQSEVPPPRRRGKYSAGLLGMISALAVLIAGAGYGVYRYYLQERSATQYFRNVKLTRVTAEGAVESATISPDGKYIAYSLEESGKRSLWTKHLGTESRVQIVPPVESISLYASAFSPDGGYVYYTRQDDQYPKGALYAVPVLGGASRKILTDVSQPISVSRDGKQIVFGRYKLTGTDDHLLVADTTGANERLLATVSEPDYLQGSAAAWSPDGRTIAVGYGSVIEGATGPSPVYKMRVAVISVDSPVFKPITTESWSNIGSMVWFSDGSGLAFVAAETRSGSKQIWQCSYPDGQARRITNDLNSYDFDSLSITADDGALIAVQKHPVSQIWVVPDGDSGKARAIATRRNVQDGRHGLGWTPDGRIVYDSSASSSSSIWIMNADGSDAKQLSDGSGDDFAPEVAPDGRHIIFGALRNGFQVWQMGTDGGNPRQMTHGTGIPTFSYSPDGRWIVFNPYLGGIYKIDSNGGDPIEIIRDGALVYPQVSPDGKLLAYLFSDQDTKRPKINVVNFDGGARYRTFDLPVSSSTNYFDSLSYRGFHWGPDGRGIVYIDTISGVSNLWSQPMDGGPARKLTDFKSDRIYSFAYAHDGRTLALARGGDTPDAVLISDVR